MSVTRWKGIKHSTTLAVFVLVFFFSLRVAVSSPFEAGELFYLALACMTVNFPAGLRLRQTIGTVE